MYANFSAADTLKYVRQALSTTVAPEVESAKAKAVLAMIDTVLVAVAKRIPVEQQYMADESNRMRALMGEAVKRVEGAEGEAADELRSLADGLPAGAGFAPLPSFEAITGEYAAISAAFTRGLGCLHVLAAEGVEAAPALVDAAREYVALRIDRDLSVFSLDGGLLGKG